MDWTVFISPLISAIVAGVGIYVAMSNKLAVLETKMDLLSEKVEKHNNVVERTYKLESDMATQWVRFDEMKDRIQHLEDHHE